MKAMKNVSGRRSENTRRRIDERVRNEGCCIQWQRAQRRQYINFAQIRIEGRYSQRSFRSPVLSERSVISPEKSQKFPFLSVQLRARVLASGMFPGAGTERLPNTPCEPSQTTTGMGI